VSGLVLVVAVLIYLGATNWMKAKVIYLTYFDTTVQGLNLDAPVKFRGVQVGRVKKIAVAPDGNLVEVMMELDPVIAVTDSLRAKLELTGITGMRYI
jgi:ABC-type transporter Mla subunit MlaD